MDIQKIASTGTAVAVLGTGTIVGGNHVIDQQTGGPQKRAKAFFRLSRKTVKQNFLHKVNNNFRYSYMYR